MALIGYLDSDYFWRPKDWKNPYMCDGVKDPIDYQLEIELCHKAYELGAEAMYKAVLKEGSARSSAVKDKPNRKAREGE